MKLKPIPELNNQISVDKETGQIYMSGPVLSLEKPIIVIRHGETDGNRRFVLQGQTDRQENQLNSLGKKQSQAAAQNLFSDLNVFLSRELFQQLILNKELTILSSPITRAKKTADFFIQLINSDFLMDTSYIEEPLLKEISFGTFDGYSLDEIPDVPYANLVRRYRKHQDASINWNGTGESFIDVLIRSKTLIESLNKEAPAAYICFCHGTIISAIRTVLGDKTVLSNTNMVLFRDKILHNASPFWLNNSKVLLKDIIQNA